MGTITLRPDLFEELQKDAERDAKSVDEAINEAVELYLRERQRAKIDREIAAYEAMHPELRLKHPDQWVAVHEGEMVDHDEDGAALYRRVRSRYGRTAVLIRQVGEHAVEEAWMRTPSTGRIAR